MQDKERDLRQLNRMLLALDAYLANEISISDLVGTLSFLFTHLDDIQDNWKVQFQDKWLLLEIINAESREEQRKLTSDEYQFSLKVAAELKEMIPC